MDYSLSSKLDAIEDLKIAFDSAEKAFPGVCDFFVKEIIASFSGRQFHHHHHHHPKNNLNQKYDHPNMRLNANFS